MNVYEVRYTDKYSHNPKICKKGYRLRYFIQECNWEISQFKPCSIMNSKYLSHKKLTKKKTDKLLFKGAQGVIDKGSKVFELWQFDILSKELEASGFNHVKRVKSKEDWYMTPFSDTYISPCNNFYFKIVKTSTWYDIYSGITESNPEYAIAKKYNGRVSTRIGHWMFHGTLESRNEARCPEAVYTLILKTYNNLKGELK